MKLSHETWFLGLKLEGEIKKKMVGEYQMWDDQIGLLAQVVECAGDGDHLDIGTMWGGSAILAALVKDRMGLDGMVYTIDPLDQRFFDENKGYLSSHKDTTAPTVEQVLENFQTFGVEDRILFKQISSADLTFPAYWLARSAFIDGAHDFDSVLTDWSNCSKYCKIIMFHDYSDASHWKDIKKVVDQYALKNNEYEVLANVKHCIAFLRKEG